MAQGLQVFDENGKEIFNSSTRAFKVLDQFNLVPNTTKVVTHPLIAEQEVVYFVTPPVMGGYDFITASKNGSSYTITVNKDAKNDYQLTTTFKITVGVY